MHALISLMTKCCYFKGYYEGTDGSFEMECYCKLGDGKTIIKKRSQKTLTYANNILVFDLITVFFDFWDSFVK